MQVFLLEHITRLVAHDFHATNLSVDVRVWVPVYPVVDAVVGNEVTQLSGKGAIDGRALRSFVFRKAGTERTGA